MKNSSMGKRLADLRAEKNEKQEVVAETIGISLEYLSKIENNKKIPSLDVIMLLKEHYETSMDYILYGQKERKCDIIRMWENLDDNEQKMVRNIMECVVEQVMEYGKEGVKC